MLPSRKYTRQPRAGVAFAGLPNAVVIHPAAGWVDQGPGKQSPTFLDANRHTIVAGLEGRDIYHNSSASVGWPVTGRDPTSNAGPLTLLARFSAPSSGTSLALGIFADLTPSYGALYFVSDGGVVSVQLDAGATTIKVDGPAFVADKQYTVAACWLPGVGLWAAFDGVLYPMTDGSAYSTSRSPHKYLRIGQGYDGVRIALLAANAQATAPGVLKRLSTQAWAVFDQRGTWDQPPLPQFPTATTPRWVSHISQPPAGARFVGLPEPVLVLNAAAGYTDQGPYRIPATTTVANNWLPIKPSPHGMAFYGASGGPPQLQWATPRRNLTDPFTLMAVAAVTDAFGPALNDINGRFGFSYSAGSLTAWAYINYVTYTITGPTYAAGKRYTAAMSWLPGKGLVAAWNGVAYPMVAIADTALTAMPQGLLVGGGAGPIYLAAAMNWRATPLNELVRLTANPWAAWARRSYSRTGVVLPGGGTNFVSLLDTAAGADTISATILLALTEAGAGADALSAVAAALALADTGAGSDNLALLTVALTLLDTGAGADTVASFILIALTDTGAGDDALAAVSAVLAVTDTSLGADDVLLAAALSLLDTGSATDTAAALILIALTDAASASETTSIAALLGLTDSGSGIDAEAVLFLVSLLETGSGSDASPTITALLALLEAATAADQPSETAAVPQTDVGAGADLPTITVSLSATDAGSATDALNLITETLASVFDAGAGAEQLSIVAAVPVTDDSSGVEVTTISVTLGLTDAGAAGDATNIFATTLIALADAAAANETVTVVASVQLSESGAAAELLQIQAAVALLDTGSAVDVAVQFVPGTRIATITFRAATGSAAFSMTSRSITFTLN